jgi:hypothetical protein
MADQVDVFEYSINKRLPNQFHIKYLKESAICPSMRTTSLADSPLAHGW